MSESPRHNKREPEPFSSLSLASTTSNLAMSAEAPIRPSTTHVFSFPMGNTAIFAPPQLIPSPGPAAAAAGTVLPPQFPTFSFVTPSGQVLLSSPVSPSLPLIGSAIVPHPSLGVRPMTNITLPFAIPTALPQTSSPNPDSQVLTSIQSSTTQIKSPSVPQTQPIQVARDSISLAKSSFISQRIIPSSSSPSHTPVTDKPHSLLETHPITCTAATAGQHTQQGARHRDFSPNQPEHTATTTSSREKSLKKLLSSSSHQSSLVQDSLSNQLVDEPDLLNFYKCFLSSTHSKHLCIEVLPSQGNLKWLQVRQRVFHINADLGPVIVARILVSSNAIVKLQLLFPVHKTIFTKLFVEDEMDVLLSELSLDHVICPGLPNYADKFSVLGYHPSHVRIFESSSVKRYDHEHCPIWHVPTGTFSKRDPTAQKMCKQCKYLQNSVVRLANKACEVDPAERESWTNPSSNRPLAYMSAADREERYRKLRQERNQMLVKLRAYEERLGIVSSSTGGNEGLSRVPAPETVESGEKVAEHLVSVTQLPPIDDEGKPERSEEEMESISSESDRNSSESGSLGDSDLQETLSVKRKTSPSVTVAAKKPIKRTKFNS